MSLRTLTRLLPVALSVLFFAAPVGLAQDREWGLEGGDDRQLEIIRRYRLILESRPEEGPIFDRLLQELGGGSRFEATLDEYRALADSSPGNLGYQMLLGHLLKHAGRLEAVTKP